MPGDGSASASSPLASNCCALWGQICTEQEIVQLRAAEELEREESGAMTSAGEKLEPWELCAGQSLNQASSSHGTWLAPASQPSGWQLRTELQTLDESTSLPVYFHQDSLTWRGSRPFKFKAHYLSRGCCDPSTRPLAHDTCSSGVSKCVKQALPLFCCTVLSSPRVQEDRSVREETMELCFLLPFTFQPTPLSLCCEHSQRG